MPCDSYVSVDGRNAVSKLESGDKIVFRKLDITDIQPKLSVYCNDGVYTITSSSNIGIKVVGNLIWLV